MANLSVGSAFGAGFRLIGRNPLAPLIWSLVSFAITSPIQIYQVIRMPGLMQQLQGNPSLGELGRVFGEFAGMALLAIPLALISGAVVSAACARAVLNPDDLRLFYLRFGRTELWLMPIGIALFVGYMICFGGGILALVFIVRAFGATLGAGGGFLGLIVGIAFWQLLLWLFLRFSFSVPMTVRDARPRLLASWGATRGVGWKLVGLVWLLLLFAIVVGIAIAIVFAIVAAVAVVSLASVSGPERLQTFANSPPAVAINVLIGALTGGYFTAILFAPLVDAYRQVVGVVGAEEVF